MDTLRKRQLIESLSTEELAQELVNNGYAFTYQAVLDKGITGRKLMEMTLGEKMELSFSMSRIQLQQFWSFVLSVQSDPNQFVLTTPSAPIGHLPPKPVPDARKPKLPVHPPIHQTSKYPKPELPIKPAVENDRFATSGKYPFKQQPSGGFRLPDFEAVNQSEKFETSSKYPFRKPAQDFLPEPETVIHNDKFATSSKYPFRKPPNKPAEDPLPEPEKVAPIDKFATSSKYPFRKLNKPVEEPEIALNQSDKFATSSKYPFSRAKVAPVQDHSKFETSGNYPYKVRAPEAKVEDNLSSLVLGERNKFAKPALPPEVDKFGVKNNRALPAPDEARVNNGRALFKPKLPPPPPEVEPVKESNDFLRNRNLIANILTGQRPSPVPKEPDEDQPEYLNDFELNQEEEQEEDEPLYGNGEPDQPEYGNNQDFDLPPYPLPLPVPELQLPVPPRNVPALPCLDSDNSFSDSDEDTGHLNRGQIPAEDTYEPGPEVPIPRPERKRQLPPPPRRSELTILNVERGDGTQRLSRCDPGDFLLRISKSHYCVVMIKTNAGTIANIPIVKSSDDRLHLETSSSNETRHFDNLNQLVEFYKMHETAMGKTSIRFKHIIT